MWSAKEFMIEYYTRCDKWPTEQDYLDYQDIYLQSVELLREQQAERQAEQLEKGEQIT